VIWEEMLMKKLLLGLLLAAFVVPAFARDVFVHGYYRKNGTYVAPYHRSSPDGNPWNNYSTRGNVNPYTGKMGTKTPGLSSGFGNSSGYGTSGGFGGSGSYGLGTTTIRPLGQPSANPYGNPLFDNR